MLNKKKITKAWFKGLQNLICETVLELEKKSGSNARFKTNKWKKGEYRIIKGNVIEKGGIASVSYTHLTLPTICSV